MSDSEAGAERRRFRRIPVTVTVRYAPRQFGDDIPPDLLEGRALDISQSGAALELSHQLQANGVVELIFMSSDSPGCVSVIGRVIRSIRIPGAEEKYPDGTPHPIHLVALEFKRTLEIHELALLRGTNSLDDTEIHERQQK